MTTGPRLRFDEAEILGLSRRYKYDGDDTDLIAIKPAVRQRGFLLKEELFKVARWKAPRNKNRILENQDDVIIEVTGFALQAKTEQTRIESLLMIFGVGWPMASVILHFYHMDRYPILDFRALWSIGFSRAPTYRFEFWWEYVSFCRSTADKNRVDLRTLDKALWQYSLENQTA